MQCQCSNISMFIFLLSSRLLVNFVYFTMCSRLTLQGKRAFLWCWSNCVWSKRSFILYFLWKKTEVSVIVVFVVNCRRLFFCSIVSIILTVCCERMTTVWNPKKLACFAWTSAVTKKPVDHCLLLVLSTDLCMSIAQEVVTKGRLKVDPDKIICLLTFPAALYELLCYVIPFFPRVFVIDYQLSWSYIRCDKALWCFVVLLFDSWLTALLHEPATED